MNETLIRAVFFLHLSATLFMCGLIWFVQVVHYPLFARTVGAEFPAYERSHTRLTGWVVTVPMFAEALSALFLLWFRPVAVSPAQVIVGAALIVTIWLSTAFLQVPCHNRLSRGFDPVVHHRLVSTNWIRTTAWSLRAALVVWMAWRVTN